MRAPQAWFSPRAAYPREVAQRRRRGRWRGLAWLAAVALGAPVVVLAPRQRGLVAPALACTGMPHLGGLPSTSAKAPLNTRVLVHRSPSLLSVTPPTDSLVLREKVSRKEVPVSLEVFGPARVDVVPAAPLTPGVEYEGVWLFGGGDSRTEITFSTFTTTTSADTAAPVLARVGAPVLERVKGPVVTSCTTRAWTRIDVAVSDSSPVTIAVWEGRLRDPDLTEPPLEYRSVSGGSISVLGDARLYKPDPGDAVDGHPGKGRRYALMAIDAAGHRSDVVFTPSGKRVPAVAIASSPPPTPAAPASSSSPPSEAPPADLAQPADSAQPADPAPSSAAPPPPASPRRGGCAGCAAGGGPDGALVGGLGLVLAVLRRRRR